MILELIYFIPSYVVFWQLYKKAGQPGWYSLIPFYNYLVMGKIVKKPTIGIITGLFSLGAWILSITNILNDLNITNISKTNTSGTGLSGYYEILATITFIWFIFALYIYNRFIKCFDRGIGEWLLYIFIPIIGMFITKKANFVGYGGTKNTPQQPTSPNQPTLTSPQQPLPPTQPPVSPPSTPPAPIS